MPSITTVSLVRTVPSGSPTVDDFKVSSEPASTKESLKDGEILVRTLYLSCDPYMRSRLTGRTDSYVASFEAGKPLSGSGVGVIEASASPKFKEGAIVAGADFPWKTAFTAPTNGFIEVPMPGAAQPVSVLGVLGMPSFTAYVGIVTLCQVKPGETILVSAASGAVGQMVVQLAKARGLRVIATAGSDEKVQFVKDLGADVAFNYKTAGDYEAAIRKAAPDGFDIYFDNVGGEFLDAVLKCIRPNGRIAECGMISQYNATKETAYGIRNLSYVVTSKITIHGFIVRDYYTTPAYLAFIKEVSALLKENRLQYKLDEVVGLENAPQGLLDLFEGKNFGKRVIKVTSRAERL
ncbi:hypothetical protein LPJ61_005095 [Coemansia biformis]|uniref:Enoyl reductase (ER) domain-containing protein n=1 Tax=Coemansia biformis TaxID=1286918 RepID=A0A9W7Y7E0_9FUNG|nr:hypothetical protein LPJ61_005095 [Coemansia biformis]